MFKTTRFHTVFAFLRPRHGPLVFRIRCSSLLFAFCKTLQKPRVFSRFLNLDSNPARAFWHPNLIFGRFPSQRAGPNGFGSFCRASAPQKLIENTAFSRVFLRFCSIQHALCSSFLIKHVVKTTRFRIFLEPQGYGSVPALPSFSVARSSKTASETNFGHFPSHAWPKKFDFVASEAIRSHFPSLIQPFMVRK